MALSNRQSKRLPAVEVVVLAAGYSSRMGSFKPLLPYGGGTFIEQVVATALQVAQRVIVVVGFQKERIVGWRAWDERIEFVENRDFAKGMFSSVKVGAAAVRAPRFFLALVDQPQVTVEIYKQLLGAEPADVVVPVYNGKRGHPILLSARVREAILRADENDPAMTLRRVLQAWPCRQVAVARSAIIDDVDTPEDYWKVQAAFGE